MNPPELELEDDPLPNRRRRSDPPFRSSNTSGLSEFIFVASIVVVVDVVVVARIFVSLNLK